MKTSDFDYYLPPHLVAQRPLEPRDQSRLLVVDRMEGTFQHTTFSRLPDFLNADDLLVCNDSRVIPARLLGRKTATGGKIEVLLLRRCGDGLWEALLKPSRRLRRGTTFVLEESRVENRESSAEERREGSGFRVQGPGEAHGSWVMGPARESRVESRESSREEQGTRNKERGTRGEQATEFEEAAGLEGEKLSPGPARLGSHAWLPVGAVPGPLTLNPEPCGVVVGRTDAGTWLVQFHGEPDLGRIGRVPLPPYVREPLVDPERYQTVYARASGSVAAPTAGLHFTPKLMDRLARGGVATAFVTIHIGLDTFRPVAVDDPASHPIHSEWGELNEAVARQVNQARFAGRRVVAVGTSSVRLLETAAAAGQGQGSRVRAEGPGSRVQGPGWPETFGAPPSNLDPSPALDSRPSTLDPFCGWTRLFILPVYQFRAVDSLLTNFHLPRTTLLMLVSAFAGRDLVLEAYHEAIREGYRFYSFGDAMLIL